MVDLSWSTAADWDAAVDANNVHHEQPAGTAWAAADTVEIGYPSQDQAGQNVVGYWPGGDTSGQSITDISGSGNDLSLTGATLGAEGILGESVPSFDGVDDFAAAQDVNCNPEAFTFVTWFNAASHGLYARIAQAGGTESANVTDGWNIQWRADGHELDIRYWDGGTEGKPAPSTTALTMGEWYFLVARTTGGQNTVRLRVFDDTGSEFDLVEGSAPRPTTSSSDLYMMAGDGRYTEGKLAHTRMYNRELSASEVEALADITSGHLQTAAQTS